MKRFFILLIFLLSLLSIITNGELNVGVQIANAQSMGSEITYYPCENYSTGNYYFSTEPCGYELPEVCVGACKYCHQQMSCDNLRYHTCPYMPQYNNGSPYPPAYDNGSNNGYNNGYNNGSNNGYNNNDNNGSKGGGGRKTTPKQEPFCKNITQSDIDKDLSKDPKLILQNGSTCSAASAQKCLAELDGKLYQKIVQDLYNKGVFKLDNIELSLPDNMRNYTLSDYSDNTYYKTDDKPGYVHVVDLILQAAFANAMNHHLPYDPTWDKTGIFSSIVGPVTGFQTPVDLVYLLNNLNIGEVTSTSSVNFMDLMSIDYTKYFVIALCTFNKTPGDYNLKGIYPHYAQILGPSRISPQDLEYWSWGDVHTTKKDLTGNFFYLIKIKRSKL